MEQRVKQRLIGAVILVALGVIFIPMLLTGPVERNRISIPVEVPPPQPRVTSAPVTSEVEPLYGAAPGSQPAKTPPSISALPANPTAQVKQLTPEDSSFSDTSESKSFHPAVMVRGTDTLDRPTKSFSRGDAAGEVSNAGWAVQVGSFHNRDNARTLRQALREDGFNTYVEQTRYHHKVFFRVRVGPLASRGEAERLAARLREARGLNGLVVLEK